MSATDLSWATPLLDPDADQLQWSISEDGKYWQLVYIHADNGNEGAISLLLRWPIPATKGTSGMTTSAPPDQLPDHVREAVLEALLSAQNLGHVVDRQAREPQPPAAVTRRKRSS